MPPSFFKHETVFEDELQSYLAAELVAGRWLPSGAEGILAFQDRGFRSRPNTTGSRSRLIEVITQANSNRLPASVKVYLSVPGASLSDVLVTEGTAKRDLIRSNAEWDRGGNIKWDLVFYEFAEGGQPGNPPVATLVKDPLPTIDPLDYADYTVPITGAALNDLVMLGLPDSFGSTPFLEIKGWVSSANVVTIRFTNYSAADPTPVVSGTIGILVFKLGL